MILPGSFDVDGLHDHFFLERPLPLLACAFYVASPGLLWFFMYIYLFVVFVGFSYPVYGNDIHELLDSCPRLSLVF